MRRSVWQTLSRNIELLRNRICIDRNQEQNIDGITRDSVWKSLLIRNKRLDSDEEPPKKKTKFEYDDRQTLEGETQRGNYHYWLQQHDVADIARLEYRYGVERADTLYEIVGSPQQLCSQLEQFQTKISQESETRPLTLIVNLGNVHWVTLVISYHSGQFYGYYVDSLGSRMPNDIRQVLEQAQVIPSDLSIQQQSDGHNCGLWALENAADFNKMLRENQLLNWAVAQLTRQRSEAHFVKRRKYFAEKLRADETRILLNEADRFKNAQLFKTIQKEFSASGLKLSLHGTNYHLKLLMLFLKRGLDNGYSFKLATEMEAAEKFDDIVFQYVEEDKKFYRLLQAMHMQDVEKNKITVRKLLSKVDQEPFSLQKYFISYLKIKEKDEFKEGEIKDLVICTNTNFDFFVKKEFLNEQEKRWAQFFNTMEGEDNISNIGGNRYRFIDSTSDPNARETVILELQQKETNKGSKRPIEDLFPDHKFSSNQKKRHKRSDDPQLGPPRQVGKLNPINERLTEFTEYFVDEFESS